MKFDLKSKVITPIREWNKKMTKHKWAIAINWLVFSILLVIIVILTSVVSFSPFLQDTINGKLLISIFGFLFFLSLVSAVLTTVIVGYLQKKNKTPTNQGEFK